MVLAHGIGVYFCSCDYGVIFHYMVVHRQVCRDSGFDGGKFGDLWAFLLSPSTQYKGKSKIDNVECDAWNLFVPNVTNITLYNDGDTPIR